MARFDDVLKTVSVTCSVVSNAECCIGGFPGVVAPMEMGWSASAGANWATLSNRLAVYVETTVPTIV